MTSKVVAKNAKELCRILDITFEQDVKVVETYLEQIYWVGRVEQEKQNSKQREFERFCNAVPDMTGNIN